VRSASPVMSLVGSNPEVTASQQQMAGSPQSTDICEFSCAAQRQAVATYLNGGNWRIIAEFTEIESGKRSDRPALEKALAAARVRQVPLVVAKVGAASGGSVTDRWDHCPLKAANKRATYRSRHSILGQSAAVGRQALNLHSPPFNVAAVGIGFVKELHAPV
jgi:Resolvase, N terminal domain